jgi:trans-aconitate methyltransferase
MHATQRVRNTVRGFLQSYGTPQMKRSLWNSEFARGRWDRPERPARDFAYAYVEAYAANGCILDLGCGAGHVASELDGTKYDHYMGVDVSDVALETARKAAEAVGRGSQNRFTQSDIATYVPAERYDVILFMESLYYIPWRRIPPVLDAYSNYLTSRGVFIVRMWTGTDKYLPLVELIEKHFDVLEKHSSADPKAVLIVFRARGRRRDET